MDNAYYEEELRYLREEGARFARDYPQRAKYLNLDSVKERDPHIERLFEGFAFFCAGVRRRLDDSFLGLTAGLTEMLWPQMLCPVPSLCVVEFKPRAGMLQGSYAVKKGAEMFTEPEPDTNVSCQFALTRDVTVNPLAVAKAEAATTAGGKDSLTLTFELDPGVRLSALRLSPLRVYIHDDLPTALLIRKMLLCHVESVTAKSDSGEPVTLVPQHTFVEGGFGEGEGDGLSASEENAGRPFGILRDYFTFPERFLFVDIFGLDKLKEGDEPPETLTLEIRFDGKIPGGTRLTTDNFRLHCAPAVNLFRRDAEPVYASGEKSEYHLLPDAANPERYTIHSVESVTGIDSVTGVRRDYGRFRRPGARERFYSLRRFRRPDGRPEIKLAMNGRQTENGRLIKEALHIETWQTNGTLPRKAAAGGGLRKGAPGFPDFITFANITAPSNPINPPPDDQYLWTFLSHTACAHADFDSAQKLKDFLYAYDWTAAGEKRPETESIISVSTRPVDAAADRAVIRGTEMNIIIDERAAPQESLYLFGTVLARALSCMASLNTFLKLVFTMSVSGKSFVWYCQAGERWGDNYERG